MLAHFTVYSPDVANFDAGVNVCMQGILGVLIQGTKCADSTMCA